MSWSLYPKIRTWEKLTTLHEQDNFVIVHQRRNDWKHHPQLLQLVSCFSVQSLDGSTQDTDAIIDSETEMALYWYLRERWYPRWKGNQSTAQQWRKFDLCKRQLA